MQWTVRFFLYTSRKWVLPPGTSTGTGINNNTGTGTFPIQKLTPGAMAYQRRKQAVWEDLATKADRLFTRANIDYQSPL
jgi:hypothetical protein